MRQAHWILIAALALYFPVIALGQDRVVFQGQPLRRVDSSFGEATSRPLSAAEAVQYSVLIVQRQAKFYWATRDMKELVRSESGSYITFTAVDGSGYVRIGSPLLLDLLDKLTPQNRKTEIGYTEHLLIQFDAITYYGNRLGAP